ncbi:YjbE family putative metal transport protein [Paraburkholderia acidisoli]|uniref:YjbE family putative metal transport protein n=1 Tax=Paraburkholderia acidisoli TaxID=2571748 RepID=A0A7Z2GPA2_9BURK|nr:YjbE family putative metal transport protein [Paraburkholderia acidisoli]QGZ65443.1 YjbE family putative metal transport protein [Paraburkholderia acidisoli]
MSFLSVIDWSAISRIVVLDIMLGVDNAVVIALACAALPAALRLRALLLGTAGAVVLRAALLGAANFLMDIPYLKIAAGAYLLYIGYKLLASQEDDDPEIKQNDKVLAAVWTIVVADLMMSLDNVLAVAAAAHTAAAHSTIYAIAGVCLSIPVIVFGAGALTKLMDRFPVIVWLGGGLLGWVGVEMALSDTFFKPYAAAFSVAVQGLEVPVAEVLGFAAVVLAAWVARRRAARKASAIHVDVDVTA